MLKVAWNISQAAKSGSKDEVVSTAKLYYHTHVEPIVEDLTNKLTNDNKSWFKKVLEKSVDKTMLIFKAIDPTETTSKWDLLGEGLKTIFQIDTAKKEREKIRSPYEYLIRLPRHLRKLNP